VVLHFDRFIVVDDHTDFAQLIASIAVELGYQAKTANSAETFRAKFIDFAPSVCFLDLIMPNEDGIEILEWLSKREELPRIILATGQNPFYLGIANKLAIGRGLNVSATITKPSSLALLRAAIGAPKPCINNVLARFPQSLEDVT
jgi:DNA-binding response OmpR family regulator